MNFASYVCTEVPVRICLMRYAAEKLYGKPKYPDCAECFTAALLVDMYPDTLEEVKTYLEDKPKHPKKASSKLSTKARIRKILDRISYMHNERVKYEQVKGDRRIVKEG